MGWLRKLERVHRKVMHKYPFERKVRTALHLRGKNLKSALKIFRPVDVSSARGYYSSSSNNIYGLTGSIVGRY